MDFHKMIKNLTLLFTVLFGMIFLSNYQYLFKPRTIEYELTDNESETSSYFKSNDTPLPDSFEHAWVMSSSWEGFMGVAIALTSDKYYYWIYSDLQSGDEPGFPFTGNYTFENGKLALEDSGDYYYATEWNMTTNGGRKCLQAIGMNQSPDRLLIPDPDFDAKFPFKNQPNLIAKFKHLPEP